MLSATCRLLYYRLSQLSLILHFLTSKILCTCKEVGPLQRIKKLGCEMWGEVRISEVRWIVFRHEVNDTLLRLALRVNRSMAST